MVGWDLFDDVGLLKVDPGRARAVAVPLGDSREVVVGEPVAAIGSPFGRESSLSASGVVAATERSIDSLTSSYALVDAIQTDAPINPGNSGGPLLDASGSVIGINAQIRSTTGTAEGVGFAVPINSAIRSMDQLGRRKGALRLGRGHDADGDAHAGERVRARRRSGAMIQTVLGDSPAQAAGLRAGNEEREFDGIAITLGGDLIVGIDGEPVENAEQVVRMVSTRLPGEKVVLHGRARRRAGRVEVELGERPAQLPTEE